MLSRHVVDRLVTDGFTVVASPLLAGFTTPTWQRLRYLVKRDDWPAPPGLCDASATEVASALRLPLDVVERYPLVGDIGILVQALDLLGLPDSQAELTDRMLQAWLGQFATAEGSAKPYRPTPVGREKVFEDWLLADLDRLSEFGYDVRIADLASDGVNPREHRFFDGRRADLILRATQDCDRMQAGDWLVVVNKATTVGSPACDQLATYVDWLRHDMADQASVHGLLIADGVSVNLGRALEERGFDYLSLATLGYRDHLWLSTIDRVRDADETAVELSTLDSIS